MSTSARIIKNTGFLYIKMGITVFISLYTTRLILNALGASDFGVFGVVGGAISMLGFLNGAMAGATQRFMNFYHGKGDITLLKRIFNNSILLHWFIAILVGVLLEIAGLFFFNGVLNIQQDRIVAAKFIYQFGIASTLFTIITVPYDAAINAHENMLYYAVIGIVESFLKLIIAFIVVCSLTDKLILYGLLMTFLTILMLIIKTIYCRRNYKECKLSLRLYFDKSIIRELTSFAGWNFFSSASSMLGGYGGGIIINYFFGTIVNAAESVGSQLRGQMMAFSNNMLKALNPVITKKEGAGNHKDMLKFAMTGNKLSYQMFAILAIPFLVETPLIMKVWLNNVPEWTVCFSRLLMIEALTEQLTITLGTMLGAVNKIKEMSIFSGCVHFLPLIIFVLIFSLGAAPYWLYVIAIIKFGLFYNSYKIYLCKKYCQLHVGHYILFVIATCISISLISFVLGYSLRLWIDEGVLRLFVSFSVTFTSYVILTYYYGYDKEEKNIINGMIYNLFCKITKSK